MPYRYLIENASTVFRHVHVHASSLFAGSVAITGSAGGLMIGFAAAPILGEIATAITSIGGAMCGVWGIIRFTQIRVERFDRNQRLAAKREEEAFAKESLLAENARLKRTIARLHRGQDNRLAETEE